MRYTIRQARAEDARAVVLMHQQAHRECYAAFRPAEFFERRAERLEQAVLARAPYLESVHPRLIAFDESGVLVGFADAGPSRDEGREGYYELYSLYTLAQSYGTGLGAELARLALADDQATELWVFEGNLRAIRFYSKLGFVADGAVKDLDGDWAGMRVMRMVRAGS